MLLSLIAWLAIAMVVGLIANKLVNLRGDDPRFALAAAAAGAVIVGLVYVIFSAETAHGWDVWGLLSAALGAGVGAAVWHGLRSRSIGRGQQSSRRSY